LLHAGQYNEPHINVLASTMDRILAEQQITFRLWCPTTFDLNWGHYYLQGNNNSAVMLKGMIKKIFPKQWCNL